jgi:hypothetical protein
MKPSVLLLLASLAANGALLAAVAFRPTPATSTTQATGAATAATPVTAGTAASARPTVDVNVPVAGLWSRLQTNNLDDLKHRLRAAGFPPREVRMILGWAIGEQTRIKQEAIRGRIEDTPYWKYPYATTPDQQAQMTELYRESDALYYKHIGGPEALADNPDVLLNAQRRFGNLPVEKLHQLTVLEHDAQQLQMEAQRTLFGSGKSPEEMKKGREAMIALEREKLAQVAKILTPAELEQYELRSPRASGLASSLAAFRPTEEEFKAIYALEKSSRDSSAEMVISAPPRGADREAYEAKVVAALGPERAVDYLALRDAGPGDRLPLLIARLELPLSTLGDINSVRSDINQRAQGIQADTSLTAAQRSAQLATLAREAEEKLNATLGSRRGYDAYLDIKGDWVRELKSKAGPGGP